jgi:hypothetical protein
MERVLAAPFLVVKDDETGVYSLSFNLEGERVELMRAISKEAFEAKLVEVFKTMNKHALPDNGPKI